MERAAGGQGAFGETDVFLSHFKALEDPLKPDKLPLRFCCCASSPCWSERKPCRYCIAWLRCCSASQLLTGTNHTSVQVTPALIGCSSAAPPISRATERCADHRDGSAPRDYLWQGHRVQPTPKTPRAFAKHRSPRLAATPRSLVLAQHQYADPALRVHRTQQQS